MSTEERPIKYHRFNIMVERKTVIVEEVCVSVDVPTFINDTTIRQGYAEELVRSKADELEWTVKNKQEDYDIRDSMLVPEADVSPPNVFMDEEEPEEDMTESVFIVDGLGIQRVDLESGQITYKTTTGGVRILNLDPKVAV